MRPVTTPGSWQTDRPVKASYDVKEGDVLELRFGERTVKVEVLVVAEHMGKTEAAAMYREIL